MEKVDHINRDQGSNTVLLICKNIFVIKKRGRFSQINANNDSILLSKIYLRKV